MSNIDTQAAFAAPDLETPGSKVPYGALLAVYHGVEVLNMPHFPPRLRGRLREGGYEGKEVACGLKAIPRGARLLEMGAGSGVVGAVLAKNLDLAAVLSIEANPKMIDPARALYAHNGLADRIELRHSVVFSAPDAPEHVTFHVTGNFLGSGLDASKAAAGTAVEVPVLRSADLSAEFPHDAIMMDIEGGELPFLRDADLSGVSVLVFEVHRKVYGREGMREIRHILRDKGFEQDEENSLPGVHIYRKI